MATLKYVEDANKWTLNKERICPVKTRNIVNKAISLNDARPGDTYFFKGQIWAKYKGYYNDVSYTYKSQFLLTDKKWDVVYFYRVPEGFDFHIKKGNLEETYDSINHILANVIYPNIGEAKKINGIKTFNIDSPYVRIINGEIVRTHPIHLTEVPLLPDATDAAYDIPNNILGSRQGIKFKTMYGVHMPIEQNLSGYFKYCFSAHRSIYTLRRAKLYLNRTALGRICKKSTISPQMFYAPKKRKWGKKSTIVEKWRFIKQKNFTDSTISIIDCSGRTRC